MLVGHDPAEGVAVRFARREAVEDLPDCGILFLPCREIGEKLIDRLTVRMNDREEVLTRFLATNRAALLKALETQWATATNPAFTAATKHRDVLFHTLAHGGKTSSGATGYVRVAYWQAKAGEEEALEAHVMKYIKPVLDADVENGTILMYNFHKEDVHTVEPVFGQRRTALSSRWPARSRVTAVYSTNATTTQRTPPHRQRLNRKRKHQYLGSMLRTG